MTKVEHYCDCCNEQIFTDRTLLKVACGPERQRRTEIDICGACLPKLVALLDARSNGDCVAPSPRPCKADRLATAVGV
jgi:hypothetical protein